MVTHPRHMTDNSNNCGFHILWLGDNTKADIMKGLQEQKDEVTNDGGYET